MEIVNCLICGAVCLTREPPSDQRARCDSVVPSCSLLPPLHPPRPEYKSPAQTWNRRCLIRPPPPPFCFADQSELSAEGWRSCPVSAGAEPEQKHTSEGRKVKPNPQKAVLSLCPGKGRPALFLSIPVISYISQKAFQVARRRDAQRLLARLQSEPMEVLWFSGSDTKTRCLVITMITSLHRCRDRKATKE